MIYLAVFVSALFAGVAWTMYYKYVEQRAAFLAAWWGSSIVLLGAFTVTQYVDNRWMILAAWAGDFAGTYLTMKFKKS